MNLAYLLMGTNIGDREKNLALARELIAKELGDIEAYSAVYESAAWGIRDQPAFLNQALALTTELNAKQLMRRISKLEKSMGRTRGVKYGPRLIDIDILFFNDESYDYHFLKLPHPEMQRRRFALLPLAEIAGDRMHPLLRKTVNQLLEECTDPLPVKKYD